MRTGIERQNSAISQFERDIQNEKRRTEPTYWEIEIQKGRNSKTKPQMKTRFAMNSRENIMNALICKRKFDSNKY